MDSIHAPPGSPFEPGLTDCKSVICSRLRTHGSVTQNMALDCVLIMRVSNEQLDNDGGIRPIPGNGQTETGPHRAPMKSDTVSFEHSVDWAKAEAMENLNTVAAEVALDAVKGLTGLKATKAQADKIVKATGEAMAAQETN